jgi:hypothetical protein
VRLVDVLARPGAEYLGLGPSERAWMKIMSELVAVPELPLGEISELAPGASIDAGQLLVKKATKTMPPRLARERLFVAAHMLVHLYADRARVAEDDTMKRRHVGSSAFIENVVDMTYGALFAPVANGAGRAPSKTKNRG